MSRPTTPTPTSDHRSRSRARRGSAALATAAAGALVLLPAGAASAHVTVQPESTAAGGYTVLTFRVPTESDTASTTALEVSLPTGTPFTSVRTEPIPGWDAQVVRRPLPEPVDVQGASITEAALQVVWTAQPGAEVGPGEFQRFVVQVGPLPDEEGTEVLLPAVQTYSDGEVVAWDEPVPAGGEEPEHPAPSLTTTAVDEAHGGTAGDEPDKAAEPDGAAAQPRDDGTARLLGGAGLVLGAGALGLTLVRGRGAGA